MTVLRVGVIGCGEAAQALHLPTLASLGAHFTVAACADADAALAERIAAGVGARALPVEALIADDAVDVVVIASPHVHHADQAIAACEAGKRAVLLEKPPAATSRLTRLIADASARTGVPVLVNIPHVYDPATERARAALAGCARSGEFWCRIGPNASYTAHLLDTLRGPPDPWAGSQANLARLIAATEVLPDPSPLAVLAHAWVVGLSIHDMPVLRRVLGEPTGVAYAAARDLPDGRLGYDAVLTLPEGRALLMVELLAHAETQWGFAARAEGLSVRVDYPTTYALSAPSTCTLTREEGGMTVEERWGGRYESGFRRAWLHLHAVVTEGAAPETPIADSVRDLELLEAIAMAIAQAGA